MTRAFSPPSLLRSWTCRACSQVRQQRPLHNTPRFRREPEKVWNFTPHGAPTPKRFARPSDIGRRQRRRLLWATAGLVIPVATVTAYLSEDARYVAEAVRRSFRVVSTLFVCIKDYRKTLSYNFMDPEVSATLLKDCHKRCADRTLVALEKNGSIFIKLGQHLSSLNYLLPSEWCDTFIPLQDKCPVSSIESIREMVLKDTGEPLENFFEEFEEEPIGAASLAQVHRATVKGTGQRVAVKVQHPLLDEWAPLDLMLTAFTFTTLKKWFPEYDLTWLSNELQSSLPLELDFNLEANNARRAQAYFDGRRGFAQLVIPNVLWAKRRILVMDYVTGHRVDDLEYLDSHHIDRDDVSATLARIFNEMIFGRDAPLHCDPHAGNIAVRSNPTRGKGGFDVILYDHGLYRDIPKDLRRNYAKMWLAVINSDEDKMRESASAFGIEGADFELFASAITGREYNVVKSNIAMQRSMEEKETISDALGDGMLQQLVQLLGKVPPVMLLILKTNDLTRALDDSLQTRQGPMRTFLILARHASRAVLDEQMERLRNNLWKPANLWAFMSAWGAYARVRLKLVTYEWYLSAKRVMAQGLGREGYLDAWI